MTIEEKLGRLGKKRLLLAIHDVSFPSDPDEDIGRGAPSTKAAARLMGHAKQLGFTGLQLGPQGQTSRDNPSPYDATIFSRHTATISIAAYRATGLVDEATIARALVAGGGPAQHTHAYDASEALLLRAHAAMFLGLRPDLRAELDEFRSANGRWLESDALYAALSIRHAGAAHRDWPAEERELWREHSPLDPFVLARMEASAALIDETRSRQAHDEGVTGTRDAIARELAALRARIEALKANKDEAAARMLSLAGEHAIPIDRYCFGQLLAHREHARVREVASRLGLALYGDLQVGYADADAWAYTAAFMASYRMGAPPSRTNPAGQPWGYPVLDPTQRLGRSAALVFARADKGFTEYDGLRLDHPHGLVCPWVYKTGTGDDGQAVRDGARLVRIARRSPIIPRSPRSRRSRSISSIRRRRATPTVGPRARAVADQRLRAVLRDAADRRRAERPQLRRRQLRGAEHDAVPARRGAREVRARPLARRAEGRISTTPETSIGWTMPSAPTG